MYYRTTIVINTNRPPTEAMKERIISYLRDHGFNVNVAQENAELTYATLTKCRHDEIPPRPCEIIQHWVLPDQQP